MRTYQEPIHVLFRDEPRQFIWRDRLLLVKEVQGRWSRSTAWWQHPEPGAGELTREREVWRVEAGNGTHRGVYELAHSVGGEDWVLQTVSD